MIKLERNPIYAIKLYKDFCKNEDGLFSFIGTDVKKAFELGTNIQLYVELIGNEAKSIIDSTPDNPTPEEAERLANEITKIIKYQVGLIQVMEDLEKMSKKVKPYFDQIIFWTDKFSNNLPDDQISAVDVAEYILNNIVIEDESDLAAVAFHIGYSTMEAVKKMHELENV